jgi:phospholipid/cholesterol/gamma-HCH transport system substrate-binding protein
VNDELDQAPVPHRRISDATLGLATIVVLAVLCVVVFGGFARKLLAPGGQRLEAVFANTGLLVKGSPVRVHGVDIGTVSGIALDPGARSTTVTMTISDSSALPIYRNATAGLKWRTILGSNYAIDLDRGTPAAGRLAAGGVIPLSRTTSQVEIDQVLATLQGRQRAGIAKIFGQLPAAFEDRPALAGALDTLAASSPSLQAGVDAARGTADGDLTRLVGNAAILMRTLRAPIPNLQVLVQDGAGTVSTTATHEADIQRTIGLAASTLPAVQLTAAELDHTLQIANPLLSALEPVVPHIRPTVAALSPTVSDANALLQQARPLLRSLRPAAAALAGAAHAARPLLDHLTPSFGEIANEILPDLAKVYSHSGRATYEMIGPTIASLDAAAASMDGVSHFVTLTPGGGERSLDTLPCQTYFVDPTAQQLIHCETLSQALAGILGAIPASALGGGR